jgi:hypothetical protein
VLLLVTNILKEPDAPIFGVEVSGAMIWKGYRKATEHKNDAVYKYISFPLNSC